MVYGGFTFIAWCRVFTGGTFRKLSHHVQGFGYIYRLNSKKITRIYIYRLNPKKMTHIYNYRLT